MVEAAPGCDVADEALVCLRGNPRGGVMAFTIRPVEYFYANVRDEVGAAYRILSAFAERGINFLAFTAVPSGPDLAQFALFPEDPSRLLAEAQSVGLPLDGPYHALLVQGDDELGAFAGVHERLAAAGVDVYASTGVTDGRGSFGYLVYVREDQFESAVAAVSLEPTALAGR
jgi:predicted amino acid-binding ACT domain protein